MKKLSFLVIGLCVVLFGCPHNTDISNEEKTVQGKQYDTISSLAYIGGSVVYNPANPSSAQLYNGANIAVHLGKMTSTAANSVTIDKDSNVYGYLKIQSVSPQDIDFDYHSFIDNEKKVVKSYNLQKGKTLDLNKDGEPDLRYKPLIPIRDGFEDAMCLEFISDQAAGYTTMYATITDELLARNAGEPTEYENATFYGINSDGSFIYITGENDAPINSRSAVSSSSMVGLSHGDYIVSSADGKIFAIVGDIPLSDANDEVLNSQKELSYKSLDDYTTKTNEELTAKQDNPVLDSNAITVDDSLELEAFFTYLYRENQFADVEKGPIDLLRVLPKELKGDFDVATCTTEEAINQLFYILTRGSIVEILVKANGEELSTEDQTKIDKVLFDYLKAIFPEDVSDQIIAAKDNPEEMQKIINKNWDKASNANQDAIKGAYLELIAMNRLCIERYYPESPRAVVAAPDISSVYPLMSLNIAELPDEYKNSPDGDAIKGSGTISGNATPTPYASQYAFTRAGIPENQLNQDYKNYLAKKDKIDAEFDKFYSMELSSITVTDIKDGSTPKQTTEDKTTDKKNKPAKGKKDKPKEREIPTDALHFEFKIGITGSFNSRWGHVDSGLASAIYVSFDGNFKNFHQNIPLVNEELFDKDRTFMIGPVPITLGFGGKFSLELDANFSTTVNHAIEFVGMYGGGADLTVDYGLIYIRGKFNKYSINHTEYYAGPVTQDVDNTSSGGSLVVKPGIDLEPSIALGPEYVYAGVGLPFHVNFNIGLGLGGPKNNLFPEEVIKKWFQIKTFAENRDLYGRAGVEAFIQVQPKIGVKIPLISKRLELSWSAATLVSGEIFLNENKTLDYEFKHIGQ